jgi:NitT/TauT family transport system permease protein
MDVAGILRAVDRSYEQLVVGMISIGIAGVASRELLGWGGRYATPWLK